MNQIEIKLQNLVLPLEENANFREYTFLMYKGRSDEEIPKVSHLLPDLCHFFPKNCYINFATYFNVLQIGKWKQYTNILNAKLKLTFKGKALLEVFEHYQNSTAESCSLLLQKVIDNPEKGIVEIELPTDNCTLLSFAITAYEDCYLYQGGYYADINKENVRDISIALASTTFKKESFIERNLQMIKDKCLKKDSDLRKHLTVHVVDNGRTLDKEKLEDEFITIHPNPNVGGSGGFARGMMEALKQDKKPNYVLLMDDDVLVVPESIFRTYYLLRILKPEFQNHFVSGAMFDYDKRETQYEDIGYINTNTGAYSPLKERLDMSQTKSLLDNDVMSNIKQKYKYSGWWYCCIPTSAIEQNGLPLPLFVRGDDVEFSLRNHAEFLTLNGISIWHIGFNNKFQASIELYQVHRNSLIIQSTSNICPDIDFIKRIKKLFWKEISRFAYQNADQLLDAVADYMKGPKFLATCNGEQCLKEHAAKNEVMINVKELKSQMNIGRIIDPYDVPTKIGFWKKLIYAITLNGHLLPNFLLSHHPEIIAYDWFFSPNRYFLRKTLIAYNQNYNSACVRKINRKKCFKLLFRYIKVFTNYNLHHKKIESAYRNNFTTFTSNEFWEEYLK